MDSNPICHPSPAKKIKCSFLDYVQLLMISWAGRWTRTPSATPLQPKNKMLISGLRSTSDDWPGWSMDSNPICHPSPAKKIKCLLLVYTQLLMNGGVSRWTRNLSATPLQPKNEMIIFGLHSTSDDRPGWSINSNPIHHPSPAKKIKCLLLDYTQLLMNGGVSRWTRNLSATPLQPKNEMIIFGLHSTSDDRPGWSINLNPIQPHAPTSPASQRNEKIKMLTQTPFWIMFNF